MTAHLGQQAPGRDLVPVPGECGDLHADELARLDLAALRSYRCALRAEETRVSYWRRLVQSRIDVMTASGWEVSADVSRVPAGSPADGTWPALRQLLTTPRGSSRRLAFAGFQPAAGRPPLPELPALWSEPQPTGDQARAATLRRLHVAERTLSDYRNLLHQRLDRATVELVVRYRADPSACLVALPSRPG